MRKYAFFLIVAVTTIVLSSCSTSNTLVQQYPKMYDEKPTSIAIMPPINQTTHAEAKDYFYTTMYIPLCEKGYYVFSPYMTMEMFQNESAYDSEQFIDADLSQFKSVLDADALMFTIIKDWRRNNILGTLTAHVQYILRSTKTGETLYKREGKITLDKNANKGSGLLGLITTALQTAATDKIEAGRKCTSFVLSDMPAGKYHPMFDKDQNSPAGKEFVTGTVN